MIKISSQQVETGGAVAFGGAIGTICRYGLLTINQSADNTFFLAEPYLLFFINILGSALLGLILGAKNSISDQRFLFLGSGICGGLTTFSTFSVDVANLLNEGAIGKSLLIGIGTPLICFLSAGLGFRGGKELV